MNSKNLIRTVVILGVLSWPAVETWRLFSTTQQMYEAQALERSVTAKLADARAKQAQLAKAETTPATANSPAKP